MFTSPAATDCSRCSSSLGCKAVVVVTEGLLHPALELDGLNGPAGPAGTAQATALHHAESKRHAIMKKMIFKCLVPVNDA
jgi:hypothetical protein